MRQTGKMTKNLPVVLYDSKFWNTTVNFQNLVDCKLIKPKDLDLFTFADTPQDAWDALLKRGLAIA